MKPFGVTLEELMKRRGLSGRELARQLSVPPKTVQEWIGAGGRIPRQPEVLLKLAEIFSCSVYFLLYGKEDPRSSLGTFLEKTEIHTGLYEITIKKVIPK